MNGTLVGFLVGGALFALLTAVFGRVAYLSSCAPIGGMVHIRRMRTNIEIDDGLIAEAMRRRRSSRPKRRRSRKGCASLVRLARQREAAQAMWGGDPDWGLEAGDPAPP